MKVCALVARVYREKRRGPRAIAESRPTKEIKAEQPETEEEN